VGFEILVPFLTGPKVTRPCTKGTESLSREVKRPERNVDDPLPRAQVNETSTQFLCLRGMFMVNKILTVYFLLRVLYERLLIVKAKVRWSLRTPLRPIGEGRCSNSHY